MTNDSRKVPTAEDPPRWDPACLEALIRQRVRETLEQVVNEELAAVLGAPRSDRVGAARQGYRHGTRERTVTTSVGPTPLTMPRGRLRTSTGTTAWPSTVIRRYQRRSVQVDEAMLGVDWSGAHSRRVRGALAPQTQRQLATG